MDHTSARSATRVKAPTGPDCRALGKRPRVLAGAAALIVLLALAISVLSHRARWVTTNDARVAADMVALSADVSGQIVATHVSSGDRVSRGDLIYEIDDREARHRLAEYEAERASLAAQIERERTRLGLVGSKTGVQVDASVAGARSARAALDAAKSELAKAEADHERAEGLFASGLFTQEALDRTRNALETARQDLRAAEAGVASAAARQREAVINKDDALLVEQDLNVLQAALARAEAQVERQKVIVSQHAITSPLDGVVDELFFDTGERTLQGFRVALLHDPEQVWIAANVKETQVRHVEIGAPVEIKVDSDPGAEVTGRVAVVRDLTLAEAALMPNPNATGVFTKITQRIPVTIDIEETNAALRPGSMVRVSIRKTHARGEGE